jgi:hypothetical protein
MQEVALFSEMFSYSLILDHSYKLLCIGEWQVTLGIMLFPPTLVPTPSNNIILELDLPFTNFENLT